MDGPESFSWPRDWESALPNEVRERIKYLCHRHRLDAHDADDVLQRVSIKLWKASEKPGRTFDSVDKLSAWAWRVARSIAHKEGRRSHRWREQSITSSDEIPDPKAVDCSGETLQELLQLIPDALHREAFKLRAEGHTFREIASILQVPLARAHKLIADVFEFLRGRLDRE
jgi:RNA polymerase sigma factor (sigma-70 family)